MRGKEFTSGEWNALNIGMEKDKGIFVVCGHGHEW